MEAVYVECSQKMKKCSMYAGVQCIQLLRSGEIETKSKEIKQLNMIIILQNLSTPYTPMLNGSFQIVD